MKSLIITIYQIHRSNINIMLEKEENIYEIVSALKLIEDLRTESRCAFTVFMEKVKLLKLIEKANLILQKNQNFLENDNIKRELTKFIELIEIYVENGINFNYKKQVITGYFDEEIDELIKKVDYDIYKKNKSLIKKIITDIYSLCGNYYDPTKLISGHIFLNFESKSEMIEYYSPSSKTLFKDIDDIKLELLNYILKNDGCNISDLRSIGFNNMIISEVINPLERDKFLLTGDKKELELTSLGKIMLEKKLNQIHYYGLPYNKRLEEEANIMEDLSIEERASKAQEFLNGLKEKVFNERFKKIFTSEGTLQEDIKKSLIDLKTTSKIYKEAKENARLYPIDAYVQSLYTNAIRSLELALLNYEELCIKNIFPSLKQKLIEMPRILNEGKIQLDQAISIEPTIKEPPPELKVQTDTGILLDPMSDTRINIFKEKINRALEWIEIPLKIGGGAKKFIYDNGNTIVSAVSGALKMLML